MLRRYRSDPSHMILIDEVEVRPDLTYEKELVQILDHKSCGGITVLAKSLGNPKRRCIASMLTCLD
ncbi:serine/threonine-protein phosphatase 6 regulatory ankyrin repeat subunit C-like [Gossypium australe]|uniref:Serine/threonine-protein phosphatase 6 regulatory ankyrin repeat subunit C-like n=1 Tax=Gossypium australe TaxID=47621 RepID=A0A5B6VNF6_9ROSI|nr:serine/threonine-protein phosphatase 6 regulatory ankyrin repeat subunit C-like [Gossypium australe]